MAENTQTKKFRVADDGEDVAVVSGYPKLNDYEVVAICGASSETSRRRAKTIANALNKAEPPAKTREQIQKERERRFCKTANWADVAQAGGDLTPW